MKPVFKRSEVVIRIPNNTIKLTTEALLEEAIGDVAYIGAQAKNYKVGDKVLFNQKKSTEVKTFGETLYSVPHEDFVICQLIEDGSI